MKLLKSLARLESKLTVRDQQYLRKEMSTWGEDKEISYQGVLHKIVEAWSGKEKKNLFRSTIVSTQIFINRYRTELRMNKAIREN